MCSRESAGRGWDWIRFRLLSYGASSPPRLSLCADTTYDHCLALVLCVRVCVSLCLLRAVQPRARHVRKRSEGSGFDTASRWTDISREEKGKWLIQEYGKVSFGSSWLWVVGSCAWFGCASPHLPFLRARVYVVLFCFALGDVCVLLSAMFVVWNPVGCLVLLVRA